MILASMKVEDRCLTTTTMWLKRSLSAHIDILDGLLDPSRLRRCEEKKGSFSTLDMIKSSLNSVLGNQAHPHTLLGMCVKIAFALEE